ncbi:MAG: hypothetical protein WCT08_00640 [Patescibacteria group bacterium]|jgi:capsular polysaccharide biosynthesis protein
MKTIPDSRTEEISNKQIVILKQSWLLILIIALAMLIAGGMYYWSQVRPVYIRRECQVMVDHVLAEKLAKNGFYYNNESRWVRTETKDCSYLDELLENKECGRPVIKELDPEDLVENQEVANKSYTPCLRRHGL